MTCSVAIDAMGGDLAPTEIVKGAIRAVEASSADDLELILVGPQATVERELAAEGWSGSAITVVDAVEVIGMAESPVEALRSKKRSSIAVGLGLVREGRAHAMVSAGNTGACVAGATLYLRLLPEVLRAGIAVTFYPGPKPVVLIDAGANVAPKAAHLTQYGIMANLIARKVLGVENPRVALLNIGEESQKGTSLAKTVHPLLQATGLNYVGNVEGGDIFSGGCDVVVCDGFVGNIVLKVSEGLAERMVELFKGGIEQASRSVSAELEGSSEHGSSDGSSKHGSSKHLGLVLRAALASLNQRIDYSEYGGAQLLGVNGILMIAHGRSDAKAIASAIRAAQRTAEANVNSHITEEIRAFSGGNDAETA